jgi:hypothetical protein
MTRRSKREDSEVEERWQEFWRDHKDYDSYWPRNILHCLAEFLPFLFTFDAVGDPIKLLYERSGVKIPSDFDWASADEDLPAGELRKLPIFRLALALRAYAYYGLEEKDDPYGRLGEKNNVFGLGRFLDEVGIRDENLPEFFPIEWGGDDETTKTIAAALARQKLDHDLDDGLKIEELAALARINQKTIKNLTAPSSGSGLRLNEHRRIPLKDARRWLLARPDFRPTIWQQQDGNIPEKEPEGTLHGEPVFVPATEDGVWFSPIGSLVKRKASRDHGQEPNVEKKCYRIGDVKFDDYWEALAALHCMEVPRWRQLDTIDRARERVGTTWLRKTRQELKELLSSMPDEVPKKKNGRR